MNDSSGQNLRRSSNVRLLLELGRGGMGVVYLALAQGPAGFNKLKVIKRLRADLASDERAVSMFLDEARLSARLHHPNVVQTNEVGFDGKHYFLEMEYLEGQSYETLARRSAKSDPLPLPLSLWILTQTLAGLDYAHRLADLDGTELRVVHRDVSPHNVFVTYDGQVKVLDFGIAKAANSATETQTGAVKGKATYMSPEQAARRAVDRRTDVFAVGVMLWQALTGARLWGERNDFEIYLKLQTGEIPTPRSAKREVSPELEAICMKALAVSPDDRFATAAEMQAAIEEQLDAMGERAPQRQLAKRMTDLFVAERKETKDEIEAQIRADAPAGRSAIDVPVLGSAAEPTPFGVGTSSTLASQGEATKLRQDGQIRGLQRTVALAIAFVVVAGVAVIASAVRSRGRGEEPSADAAAIAAPKECTTNKECTAKAGNKPSICRKDTWKCAPLESDDCKVLAGDGDVENDQTIWFGAMFPMTGPRASRGGLEDVNALDLARRDFMEISHGIPSNRADAQPRPIAVIACDDAKDPGRSARHLSDEVGVPAVMGFGTSQEVIDLSSSTFIPNRQVVVASHNMSTLITGIPHPRGVPRLVWRTSLSGGAVATPVALLVSQVLEPKVRAAGALPKDGALRVALLRTGSTTGLSFADALFAAVRFNGKNVVENGEAFEQVVVKDVAADGGEDTSAAAALVKFRPHIVLCVGQGELVTAALSPLERAWPKSERQRPYYVFTNALYGDEIMAFAGSSAERRARIFGFETPAATPANAQLTMRYNETFAEKVTLNRSPTGSYDAMYLLAYASYVADEPVLTGPALAKGIARLVPPGKPIDVGPTRIFEVFEALKNGENVDLNGAGNRLDFDLANGESPGEYVVQCLRVDATGKAYDATPSGLAYDPRTKSLGGSLACP